MDNYNQNNLNSNNLNTNDISNNYQNNKFFNSNIVDNVVNDQNNNNNNLQQSQQMSQDINLQQQNVNMDLQLTNNILNTNNGICKLTLTRPNAFVGSLWNLKIYVDGEKKGILKNGKSITLDIKSGNHHISFGGYTDYTLQVFSNATATVIPTDSRQILLQDLIGANIIEDENNSYNKKSRTISSLIVASSMIVFLLSTMFSQFMSNITVLSFIIAIDFIISLIGFYLTKQHKNKLGYAFKKIMYDYIGAIIINIISIIMCLIIKGF